MFKQGLDLFGKIMDANENNQELPGTAPVHIHPSSASVKVLVNGSPTVIGGCNRKQYLQLKFEQVSDRGYISEDIGPGKIGDLLQDYVEDQLFKRAGVFVQNELKIYLPQWNVSGRVDTILRDEKTLIPVNGGYIEASALQPGDEATGPAVKGITYYGVEIKSKSGYQSEGKYIRAKKSTAPTDFRPQDEHLLQAMVYLYACRTIPSLQPYKITKWFIFYVLREDGKYNYFEVELTDFDSPHGFGYPVIYSNSAPNGFIYKRLGMDDVIKRWEELNFCCDLNILPDRDYFLTYPIDRLNAMLANGDDLSKENRELIGAGKHTQCVVGKGTANERPLGDFECYTCPFKSKCWGLGGRAEHDFDVCKAGRSISRVKYSQFNPFKSTYFDKLTEEQKALIRKECNA